MFFVDGFKIAREEAGNPDLQYRMQGTAFQGAFFVASPMMESANLSEKELFRAIEDQLQAKFGSKGKSVVEDNLRVVRRGFDEIVEIIDGTDAFDICIIKTTKCSHDAPCSMHDKIGPLRGEMKSLFITETIADLAGEFRQGNSRIRI